ncbi:Rha family transcriptional regulator [Sphingobium sp. H39-3-25]|uniref:Rha family transcriptional regulator n=1 Tax=Sphingobium arseniciresistens TaxID=3030834 RepID=UPI0023BA2349|nr:Rha family transcriptional regulator [Sphingobium arseniciresistens]
MSALVKLTDHGVRASSLDVARSFGKQHQHVMRSIRALVEQCPDLASNFGLMIMQIETGKGAKRSSRYYEMDRKGFVLLVMGFTGPKALEWKIAYIDAFDRMEAMLAEVAANDVEAPLLPASSAEPSRFIDRIRMEPPMVQLAFVRERRLARGRPAAIAAMRDLGWDDDDGLDDPVRLLASSDPVLALVSQWLDARTERVAGYKLGAMVLYADHVRWCADTGHSALTVKSFSMALEKLGYQSRRSNIVYKIGLKLRP